MLPRRECRSDSPFHPIRLRGPWQGQPLARTRRQADGSTQAFADSLPARGRIKLPQDWTPLVGPQFSGRVRFVRRFGCPSGLDASERVDLVIERINQFGLARLNDQQLGELHYAQPHARFDVTSILQPRNELHVEVEYPEPAEGDERNGERQSEGRGLIGEVRLEIYRKP